MLPIKAESCLSEGIAGTTKTTEIERSLLEYPISGGRVFIRICLQITPPHLLRRHHTDGLWLRMRACDIRYADLPTNQQLCMHGTLALSKQ